MKISTGHRWRTALHFCAVALCWAISTAACANTDSLDLLLLREGRGTRTGYVDDSGCATCHPATYASYQGVGMAQSLQRPNRKAVVEDFRKTEFTHAASQSHFSLAWNDDALMFKRWQLDAQGQPINAISQRVDWVLGSGHRSRVYLYRTPSGELYQLPVAWYAQEQRLDMAPGYDRADHDGLTRRVRRECLFCHDAYPEQAKGSDAHWMPQTFPTTLPEGTGCQRCHGPGAKHVRSVIGNADAATIRSSIVNPARLTPARRDDVCFQCHLLPAVAVIGARRFDRTDYSFRPGEALDDYLLHVDTTGSQPASDRFEINHHAYRLTQSPCYQKGGITCIDCHNPHKPLAEDPRLAGANAVCARCHAPHAPASEVAKTSADATNCVSCHMQRRRTQDVVHVTMTDHRIGLPREGDLLAPLREREADVRDVQLLHPAAAPGAEGELYRTLAILRADLGGDGGIAHLQKVENAAGTKSSVPRFDEAAIELARREFAQALVTTQNLLEENPGNALATAWHGAALMGLGKTQEALVDLQKATTGAPESPEFAFNLGMAFHALHREEEALAAFSRAVALRPNFTAAWVARGSVHSALKQRDEAIADFLKALAIQPRETRAYLALATLLDTAQAHRYLQIGSLVAAKPEAVRTALEKMQVRKPSR